MLYILLWFVLLNKGCFFQFTIVHFLFFFRDINTFLNRFTLFLSSLWGSLFFFIINSDPRDLLTLSFNGDEAESYFMKPLSHVFLNIVSASSSWDSTFLDDILSFKLNFYWLYSYLNSLFLFTTTFIVCFRAKGSYFISSFFSLWWIFSLFYCICPISIF